MGLRQPGDKCLDVAVEPHADAGKRDPPQKESPQDHPDECLRQEAAAVHRPAQPEMADEEIPPGSHEHRDHQPGEERLAHPAKHRPVDPPTPLGDESIDAGRKPGRRSFQKRPDGHRHMRLVEPGPAHQWLSQTCPRREAAEHAPRLFDLRRGEPQLLDRLPTALPRGNRRGRLPGEQSADHPATSGPHPRPEGGERLHRMEEGREWPAVPPFDDLGGEDPLPGRAAGSQPRADRPRKHPIEPLPLARHAGGELHDGLPQGIEALPRLPEKPADEIEAAGAANAAGGAAHQFRVDRCHQFAEAGVGLESGGGTRGRLDRVEPENPRHDEAL